MRRHNNLYSRIHDFENLHLAFRKASRVRRFTSEVLAFRENLEENLISIQDDLITGVYEPSPYRTFTIYEPKERIIHVAPFRDRVVHHAVMNIIEPIWDRLFIYDTYACRKGKGTHAGVNRTISQGHYTPNNCRWATRAIQAENKRNVRNVKIMGITMSLVKAGKMSGLHPETIALRLAAGIEENAAVFAGPKTSPKRRPVIVDGEEYPSLSAAGRKLGVTRNAIFNRLKYGSARYCK